MQQKVFENIFNVCMVAYIVRTGILHDRFCKFKLVCRKVIIQSDSRDPQAEIMSSLCQP